MSTFIGDFSRFLAARRDLRLAAVTTPEGTFGAGIGLLSMKLLISN
jgi:hypothetical protein